LGIFAVIDIFLFIVFFAEPPLDARVVGIEGRLPYRDDGALGI